MVKILDEKTLTIADKLVVKCFGAGEAKQVLHRELSCPFRSEHEGVGYIGFDGDHPVCVHAFFLKRYYYKRQLMLAKIGAMSCNLPNAPVEPFIDVKARMLKATDSTVFRVTNSMNRKSAEISRRTKASRKVPDSCSRYLRKIIRPIGYLCYIFKTKILKIESLIENGSNTNASVAFTVKYGDFNVVRLSNILPEFFDRLMDSYLETNQGLVASRKADDLEWIFGKKVRNGKSVVLGISKLGEPSGFIIATSDDGRRWVVQDMLAVKNEGKILSLLIKGMSCFLKKHTRALYIDVNGFPTYVQPLFKKYFPFVRPLGHTTTSWNVFNRADREKFDRIVDSEDSWFFGPFDGDICL